jgi:branched-chain amino acid transport system ATP-binding protein
MPTSATSWKTGAWSWKADAEELRTNEDVKEFYLGLSSAGRKSFKDVKHYRRRKRWLS